MSRGAVLLVAACGLVSCLAAPAWADEGGAALRSEWMRTPFATPGFAEALVAVREHAVAVSTGVAPEASFPGSAHSALREGLASPAAGELSAATLLALRIFAEGGDATAAAATAAVAAMIEPALAGELWLVHSAQALRGGLAPALERLPEQTALPVSSHALLARVHAVMLARAGELEAARAVLAPSLERDEDDEPGGRELDCRLGAQLLEADASSDAAARLARALETGCAGLPESDAAAALRASLAPCAGSDGVGAGWADALSPAARLQAARRLYVRVEHDAVLAVLAPIADGSTAASTGQRCEALWRSAMTLRRSRRAEASRAPYTEMLELCAALPEWRQRALYGVAWNDFREDNQEDARQNFELILEMYRDTAYADDAIYHLARLASARGDAAAAAAAIAPLLDGEVALDDLGGDAIWRALEDLEGEARRAALEAALAPLAADGSYFSQGRVAYVLGLEAQRSELLAEVVEQFPLTFYAALALSALGERAADDGDDAVAAAALADWADALALAREPARELTFAPLPTDGAAGPAVERARLWLAGGWSAHAARLLEAEGLAVDGPSGWVVAYGYHLEGHYARSHDLARRVLGGWRESMPDPSNRLLWEIAYPRPYVALVEAAAQESEIPAALIWAIMREESGFRPRVESYAHAIGLMQLLESTAESHARRAFGLAVDATSLREPAVNIRVGAAFLGHLARKLAPHPVLMAAAYNAGRGAVGKWLDARGELALHAFVEAIPYTQTRDYSKRVNGSLLIYRVLYGSEPVEPLRLTRIASPVEPEPR